MLQQLRKERRDWDEKLPAELSAVPTVDIESNKSSEHRDRDMLHKEQRD